MKICFFLYYVENYGGAERRLLRVYNEIAKKYPIDLILRDGNENLLNEQFDKMDINENNFSNVYYPQGRYEIFEYLLRGKYTVAATFDVARWNRVVFMFCKLLSMKTICTFASAVDAFEYGTDKMKKDLKKQLRFVDIIDCLYPGGVNTYERLVNGKRKSINITPGTFTDLQVFVPKEKKKIIVFAAARLSDDKNPWLVVWGIEKCASELRKHGYKILMLGQGYEENNIREKIEELGLDDVITMTGYKRTSDIMPFAEVFLSLQKNGNYPSQSLAEAIACGCYSIVTDIRDSREMVLPSFSKMIKDDPDELAAAVIEYISFGKELQQSIFLEARKFAEKKFNMKSSVDYFEGLIKNAVT